MLQTHEHTLMSNTLHTEVRKLHYTGQFLFFYSYEVALASL